MVSYEEHVYWHRNSYGRATRIPRKALQTLFIIICAVTPATNWLIPFSKKLIRQDLVFRYA